ncbi:hypothetical protein B1218_36545, partial [Pseudomonas ogarae]
GGCAPVGAWYLDSRRVSCERGGRFTKAGEGVGWGGWRDEKTPGGPVGLGSGGEVWTAGGNRVAARAWWAGVGRHDGSL